MKEPATDRDPGKLERDGAGMADDPCANPDQLGQRPVGNLPGQISALQEATGIAGRCMKLKPHLVLRHALARQSGPVDRLLALFDVLPGSATLVVEADDPVRLHRQVGDDESDAGKQLARAPLDPGDDTTGFVP